MRLAITSSLLRTSESDLEILSMKFEDGIWMYDSEKVVSVGCPGKYKTKIITINKMLSDCLSKVRELILFEIS